MTQIGIYEKALPKGMNWQSRLRLVKELGFDFLELSIDESDERLARLNWTDNELAQIQDAIRQTGVPIRTLMLSGHRRYPLGSTKIEIQEKALRMGCRAIDIAEKLGIRHIQLAGYDVFYEKRSYLTREYFMQNLISLVKYAASKEVMLDIETMDDPFINSLTKVKQIKERIKSPWLQAYPDLGNLSAWTENNVAQEIENNLDIIAHIHLKDTLPVTPESKGQFKDVPFGSGTVDFIGLLKLLTDLGYDGAYTIEMWSENSLDPISEVKKAQAFFKPILEMVGLKQEEQHA
ncbi:L-ribulose-5-phosphate 3-epimerase [Periweissella beninensis]|uniref:L-ribulose-5-phosphate 3-epimerase n=1 Tax=Periweissella beninensis TaxID=504936 RepID=UPI0021A8A171|nr:L-ribulose-5-phosphate 3-epimerase [Periweissella beninensis]MCT4396497.1 L-ribulose-5-phosphate 3-epimerase [Periweissella beninensis]